MNAKWRMHAAVITFAACLTPGNTSAQEQVIIASTGGAYDRALREAW